MVFYYYRMITHHEGYAEYAIYRDNGGGFESLFATFRNENTAITVCERLNEER